MLGSRIAFLRKKHGFSQAELAEKIGVSPGAISNYEQGKRTPSCEKLLTLSKVFDVSVQYLLSGEESIESNSSTLPELLLQTGIAKTKHKNLHRSGLSDGETAVLLAALLTMEDK